jgi:hypothetical protein
MPREDVIEIDPSKPLVDEQTNGHNRWHEAIEAAEVDRGDTSLTWTRCGDARTIPTLARPSKEVLACERRVEDDGACRAARVRRASPAIWRPAVSDAFPGPAVGEPLLETPVTAVRVPGIGKIERVPLRAVVGGDRRVVAGVVEAGCRG